MLLCADLFLSGSVMLVCNGAKNVSDVAIFCLFFAGTSWVAKVSCYEELNEFDERVVLMKLTNVIAAGLIFSVASVSGAFAATVSESTVGFELGGHAKKRNFGVFALTNTSTDAEITSMSLTIGKKKYNFDIVRSATARVTKGDTRNGKQRVDEIAMAFDNFGAGKSTKFRLDIDKDKGKKRNKADYSRVLFNNGRARNAMITVTFSNGQVLSTFLDDRGRMGLTRQLDGGTGLVKIASAEAVIETLLNPDEPGNINAVPVPAALPLMLGGLFGLGMVGRRRKA